MVIIQTFQFIPPVIYDTETGNYEIVEYNLDTSAGHPNK